MTEALPPVDVVMPCHDEQEHVRDAVESVLAADYPPELLRLIVVDGMSTDGTPAILAELCQAHGPRLLVLPNPQRTAATAANLGFAAATAPLVALFGAHAVYPPATVRALVDIVLTTGAEACGVTLQIEPRQPTALRWAIASISARMFGFGLQAARQAGAGPRAVRSASFAVYRREAVLAVGGFEERLGRGMDRHLNERLVAAGGRVLRDPATRVIYRPRASVAGYLRLMFRNGHWVAFGDRIARARLWTLGTAAPALVLVGTGLLALAWLAGVPRVGAAAGAAAAVLAALYAAAVAVGGVRLASRAPVRAAMLFAPPLFVLGHVAHTLGSLTGMLRPVRRSTPSRVPTLRRARM